MMGVLREKKPLLGTLEGELRSAREQGKKQKTCPEKGRYKLTEKKVRF